MCSHAAVHMATMTIGRNLSASAGRAAAAALGRPPLSVQCGPPGGGQGPRAACAHAESILVACGCSPMGKLRRWAGDRRRPAGPALGRSDPRPARARVTAPRARAVVSCQSRRSRPSRPLVPGGPRRLPAPSRQNPGNSEGQRKIPRRNRIDWALTQELTTGERKIAPALW
jgi:hypothetical protein